VARGPPAQLNAGKTNKVTAMNSTQPIDGEPPKSEAKENRKKVKIVVDYLV
jgi:hypothetical protein